MLKYMCYISMEGEPFGAVFGASNIPIGLMVIKLKEEMLGEKNETVAFFRVFSQTIGSNLELLRPVDIKWILLVGHFAWDESMAMKILIEMIF